MTAIALDLALAPIAHRRDGVFNRDQARHLGFTDEMIKDRVTSGRWVRLEAEVFTLPGYPGTLRRQCWAAVLGSPGSAVGGLAASKLLNHPGIGAGKPEIVLPPGSNSRSGLAIVHRYDGAKLTRLGDLPITTAAQTVFDIASRVSIDRLERVIDDQVLSTKLTIDDLDERLQFYAGTRRAGLPVMRALIEDRREDGWAPAASELERLADRITKRLTGQPKIVKEAKFPWLERGEGRIDRFLVDEGILWELDGRRWHARFRDFDRDRWRDSLVVANGLLPLRFTYVHVTTRPREVLELIEQTRRLRRRERAAA